MRFQGMMLFDKPAHIGETAKEDTLAGTGRKAVAKPLWAGSRSSVVRKDQMRILILAVAGVLSLVAATANAASPGSSERPPRMGAAPGIVQVWGGCGPEWHPVPGHWSQWRGGWVPPHCAPNRYYGDQGPYPGWGGPDYRGWGASGGWYGPYGGGGYYGGRWGNP